MTRVTISVPEDLHRAIQGARGRLLLDEGADVTYSSFISSLAYAGIFWMAIDSVEWPKRLPKEWQKYWDHIKTVDDPVYLTAEERGELILKILSPISEVKIEDMYVSVEPRFGVLASEMIPHILKKEKKSRKKSKKK